MFDSRAKAIADRFEECVETLQRIPGGVSLGYKNFWPDIHRERPELARQESKPARLKATPDQISRMEETLTWITLVSQGKRDLIWMRAAKRPWREISGITGFPRTSAQRYWHRALLEVADNLQSISSDEG